MKPSTAKSILYVMFLLQFAAAVTLIIKYGSWQLLLGICLLAAAHQTERKINP